MDARKGKALGIGEKNEQLSVADLLESEPGNQSVSESTREVVCPNCGGAFSIDEARCPYCNTLNPTGAEKAYMGELSEIREDTGELVESAEDGFKAGIRSNFMRTVAAIVIVVAAVATMAFAFSCMEQNAERQELQEYRAREAFRTQYFEEFDRLYEAGDDDALSAYVWSLFEEPGFDALFSWKHVGYLQVHDDWGALRSAEELIDEGSFDIDDYTWTVSTAYRLAQINAADKSSAPKLSAEEEQRAAGYRAYARQFLQDTLQLSFDEVVVFADDARDAQGAIQDNLLRDKLETHLKQLGVL